ncbi:hypothetical protein HY227_02295 [Candidatus Wolfebacteria bacterium]|nr:hypothetical protein [Candidatus Wolfebacteria bacterium]
MEEKNYIEILKDRSKTSHVYKKFQLTGLLISQILNDEKHKSLYIKLAKKHSEEKLMRLAKEVGERKGVKNKGAYFMKLLQNIHEIEKKNGGTKNKNFYNK